MNDHPFLLWVFVYGLSRVSRRKSYAPTLDVTFNVYFDDKSLHFCKAVRCPPLISLKPIYCDQVHRVLCVISNYIIRVPIILLLMKRTPFSVYYDLFRESVVPDLPAWSSFIFFSKLGKSSGESAAFSFAPNNQSFPAPFHFTSTATPLHKCRGHVW